MRRTLLLLPLFFVLCACRAGTETDERGIRDYYAALPEATFQVAIEREYADRIDAYRVEYAYRKDAESTITLREPESIAGVTVRLRPGETELEFGETRLAAGALDEGGVTPLSCLPQLMRLWANGEVSGMETASENGTDLLLFVWNQTVKAREVSYRTWFSRDTYAPVRAEIYENGRRILCLAFELVK